MPNNAAWTPEQMNSLVKFLKPRIGLQVTNSLDPNAQELKIREMLGPDNRKGGQRILGEINAWKARQEQGYRKDVSNYWSQNKADSWNTGKKILGYGAAAAALGGGGLALYRWLKRKKPDDIINEEGMEAMPGTSFVDMPWVSKASSFDKDAGIKGWGALAIAGLALKDKIAHGARWAEGHARAALKPTNYMHYPSMYPALALGLPSLAGLAYMLTNKGIAEKKDEGVDAETASIKKQLQEALASEYSSSIKEGSYILNRLTDVWERGELFEKDAEIPAPYLPPALKTKFTREGMAMPGSPVTGFGGAATGIAALIAAGLLMTSMSASKAFFDKNDPNRARAKALRDALRQKMRMQQPRLQMMPPLQGSKEDDEAVESIIS